MYKFTAIVSRCRHISGFSLKRYNVRRKLFLFRLRPRVWPSRINSGVLEFGAQLISITEEILTKLILRNFKFMLLLFQRENKLSLINSYPQNLRTLHLNMLIPWIYISFLLILFKNKQEICHTYIFVR